MQTQVDQNFDKGDTNNDGFLGRDEVQAMTGKATETIQGKIEQEDVGAEVGGQLQGGGAVEGGDTLVTLEAEENGEALDGVVVVINHQNAEGSHFQHLC